MSKKVEGGSRDWGKLNKRTGQKRSNSKGARRNAKNNIRNWS